MLRYFNKNPQRSQWSWIRMFVLSVWRHWHKKKKFQILPCFAYFSMGIQHTIISWLVPQINHRLGEFSITLVKSNFRFLILEAGINLLLCLSVYLMLVNSKMPITSKSFPLLTKFYGCTIVLLVVSLCCSCWVYSFYFVNPSGWDVYHIPKWLQVK